MIRGIIVSILFVIIFVGCRYKDNDKLVIATVKQRIEKTWYLKGYILNDSVVNINYSSTLKITMPTNKILNIDCNNIGSYTQYLFEDKKNINTGGEIPRALKITKLTKNELWLDGYRIFPTVGYGVYDKIKAKYSSTP